MIQIFVVVYFCASGTSQYDEHMSRCSLTSTRQGKVAHMILQTLFVIIPSFTCLGLYLGIVVILVKNKRKDRGGVTNLNHAFITITILLALFYLSHWPSVLLRDIPRLLQTKILLPKSLNIATSVFYYLNGLTDPIIYGYRSQFLFTRAKTQTRLSFSRRTTVGVIKSSSGNSLDLTHSIVEEGGVELGDKSIELTDMNTRSRVQ